MSFHTVMCWITLSAAVVLIAAALVLLNQWRRSAFCGTTALLRKIRHIAANEPVVIPSGKGGFRAGKHHPPLICWEYVYRVNRRDYVLADWNDDNGSAFPASVTVFYHNEHPDRAFIRGNIRDGASIAGFLLFLGLLFLVLSLINLL